MTTVEMAIRPLLRWAGSKKRLLPQLKKFVPRSYNRYYEPFAGSACLFFSILPRAATLGDFNDEVIHLYRMIQRDHQGVATGLSNLAADGSQYYELRAKDPANLTDMERAVRFLYLNRFSFNGVYRTNRQGMFNVPRGKHTGRLPSRSELAMCAAALESTTLIAGDFIDTLVDAAPGDFVYLDPPYAKTGRAGYGEYGYGAFAEHDRPRLVQRLLELHEQGTYVLLSYSTDPYIGSELSGWHVETVAVRRNVSGFTSGRGMVEECLVTNQNILG